MPHKLRQSLLPASLGQSIASVDASFAIQLDANPTIVCKEKGLRWGCALRNASAENAFPAALRPKSID
jgi:hypothetical protein